MKKLILISILVANVGIGALKLFASDVQFRPVSNQIVLSHTDIASVSKSKTDTGANLSITLTKTGAESLGLFSVKHPGEHLAILVQDKVVSAPIMKAPIVGNTFVLSGLSDTEADQLLKVLRP